MPRLLADVAFRSARLLGRELLWDLRVRPVGAAAPSTVMLASCEYLKIQISPVHGSSEKRIKKKNNYEGGAYGNW